MHFFCIIFAIVKYCPYVWFMLVKMKFKTVEIVYYEIDAMNSALKNSKINLSIQIKGEIFFISNIQKPYWYFKHKTIGAN